jgi:hypothetical protein
MEKSNIAEIASKIGPVSIDSPERKWVVTDTWLKQFATEIVKSCVTVCEERATLIEQEAQRAIDNSEHDEVSSLRAMAWQLTVTSNLIKKQFEVE